MTTKKDKTAAEQAVEKAVEKTIDQAYVEMMGSMPGVAKTGHNPMFKSEYITLDDIIAVVRAHLAKHGFALKQTLLTRENGDTVMETVLVYKTGEKIVLASIVLPDVSKAKNVAQAFGSMVTYFRRYSICTGLGLSVDPDDDGNSLSGVTQGAQGNQAPAANQSSTAKAEVPMPERQKKLKSALAKIFGNDTPSVLLERVDAAKTEEDLKTIYADAQEVAKAVSEHSADSNA